MTDSPRSPSGRISDAQTAASTNNSHPERPPVQSPIISKLGQNDEKSSASYKSWKKKYNKLRHAFKDTMNTSNALFDEEQKLSQVARRLQEQNDQLLELLFSVNTLRSLPTPLRYDLDSSPPPESSVPPLSPSDGPSGKPKYSKTEARAVLDEARAELASNSITDADYLALLNSLRPSLGNRKVLSALSKIPHSTISSVPLSDMPSDLQDEPLDGYLSPAHEEEYLTVLDASIDGLSAGDTHAGRGPERILDAATKNPVSVYNWLRKHQPQVFLQDGETGSHQVVSTTAPADKEVKSKAAAATETSEKQSTGLRREGTRKRGSVIQEVLDDEGYVIGGGVDKSTPFGSSSKTKRKRDDEPYRPKGGSSSRVKRKRTSTNKGAGDAD